MTYNRTLLRVNLAVIVSFILIKFVVRPFVLANGFPRIIEVFVLSYPNFCEAVVGTLLLVHIGLFIKLKSSIVKFSDKLIYLLGTIMAGVFVILQEFKVHNLGGENVYDKYDVLFSVLGLGFAYLLILKHKPASIA